jgi:hypothetical protein
MDDHRKFASNATSMPSLAFTVLAAARAIAVITTIKRVFWFIGTPPLDVFVQPTLPQVTTNACAIPMAL